MTGRQARFLVGSVLATASLGFLAVIAILMLRHESPGWTVVGLDAALLVAGLLLIDPRVAHEIAEMVASWRKTS